MRGKDICPCVCPQELLHTMNIYGLSKEKDKENFFAYHTWKTPLFRTISSSPSYELFKLQELGGACIGGLAQESQQGQGGEGPCR